MYNGDGVFTRAYYVPDACTMATAIHNNRYKTYIMTIEHGSCLHVISHC